MPESCESCKRLLAGLCDSLIPRRFLARPPHLQALAGRGPDKFVNEFIRTRELYAPRFEQTACRSMVLHCEDDSRTNALQIGETQQKPVGLLRSRVVYHGPPGERAFSA